MDKPSFYWGIASYDRADRQPMLAMLSEMGYRRDEIILATQTPTDYEKYSERYGEMATVIFRDGRNVSDNKNTVLSHICDNCGNTRVVMCSDKVRAVNALRADGKLHPIKTREELDHLVKSAYYIAERTGASIWGVAPVANTFYMERSISTNLFLIGCFMGLTNPAEQMFDAEQPLKEDWEITLRTIASGGRTIRFNDVCLTSTLHTKGGCHAEWNSEGDRRNAECTGRLLAMYPDLVKPHARRKNELRYVGKTQKIKHSIFDL